MTNRKTRRLYRRLEEQERFEATLLGKVKREFDFAVAIVFFVLDSIIRATKKTVRRTGKWFDEHFETIITSAIVLGILYVIPSAAIWLVNSLFGGL